MQLQAPCPLQETHEGQGPLPSHSECARLWHSKVTQGAQSMVTKSREEGQMQGLIKNEKAFIRRNSSQSFQAEKMARHMAAREDKEH